MADPAMLVVDHTTRAHLRGPFAPVADELDVDELPVRGELPPGLRGTYLRNGPNPQFAPLDAFAYPFAGDGMLHAVSFEGGRVRYRNRWVLTESLVAERRVGSALAVSERGPRRNWSNTSVVSHGGRILSLGDSAVPYEMTPALGTVGEYTFGGTLGGPMGAHPKVDPVWDELGFIRTDIEPPYLLFGVVDTRGTVNHTVTVDIPRPVLMHDFAMTDQHVVFFDSPAVLDPAAPRGGVPRPEWREEYGTRIGVMPRGGGREDLRWFTVENRFVLHVANAYTQGERVIVDHIHRRRIDDLTDDRMDDAPVCAPRLCRTTIDLTRGTVTDELLDARFVDFPRIDERRSGLPYRTVYLAASTHGGGGREGMAFDTLVRFDVDRRTTQDYRFPEGIVVGEPTFVPRPDSTKDDDGWILALAYDTTQDSSELVILEANRFELPPLARVPLPRRVPAGLHGTWVPA